MSWLFAPQPRGRIAALRTVAYLFVPVDLLLVNSWVAAHADVPGGLYQPLMAGRLLHLPAPGPVSVRLTMVALLVTAVAAATGRRPRLLGTAVALLYAWWMVVAMSYGKVDHDRFAYLVLLAVLPTVGPARHGDTTEDEESGWALRCVQLAVIATYFLAAFAKFRFGGWNWATGATLSRAILRRGSFVADPLLEFHWVMIAVQWGIITFELASPLILVPRLRRFFVAFFFLFHLASFVGIGIIFMPHLVALLSFVRLERLTTAGRGRRVREGVRARPVSRAVHTPMMVGEQVE
jgi:hypothetical protein